jgi:hypothetical protein
MDGTRYHHVKQNKPGSERQTSHIFSHISKLQIPKYMWHECKLELFSEDEQEGTEKKRMIVMVGSITSKYIVSMYENGLMKHTKNLLKWVGKGYMKKKYNREG